MFFVFITRSAPHASAFYHGLTFGINKRCYTVLVGLRDGVDDGDLVGNSQTIHRGPNRLHGWGKNCDDDMLVSVTLRNDHWSCPCWGMMLETALISATEGDPWKHHGHLLLDSFNLLHPRKVKTIQLLMTIPPKKLAPSSPKKTLAPSSPNKTLSPPSSPNTTIDRFVGQQGHDLAHPGVAPIKMNGREPVYHKYYQVGSSLVWTVNERNNDLSVGLLRSLLPSRVVLRSPISLESCWRGPGQHARCGGVIVIINHHHHLILIRNNPLMIYQDMYGPSMVINKDERSDRIRTIVKYFKEMRGRWEFNNHINNCLLYY